MEEANEDGAAAVVAPSTSHDAAANEQNERYFEILQNYELERLQKETEDKEIEEQLLRDIERAMAMSLQDEELRDIVSDETLADGGETGRLHVKQPAQIAANTNNNSAIRRRTSVDDEEDNYAYELRILKERGLLPADFKGPDKEVYACELRLLTERGVLPNDFNKQDDEDDAHELKVLKKHGILPADFNSQHPEKESRIHPTNLNEQQTHNGRLCSPSRQHQQDRDMVLSGNGACGPSVALMDILHPFPFDRTGIPVNWNKSTIPSNDSDQLYTLNPLFPGEDEYETIATDFCMADLEVIKIERLQNLILLRRFQQEREHLQEIRQSGFELNTRYLYHGTTVDKLRICEEGLDARLSMTGCFGRGIYFSDSPKKCIQYAKNVRSLGGEDAVMLMCRVILGHAKEYPKGQMDRTLKREPEKESPTGGWRFYDSVKGCPIDFNEFVVYENRRAMIEYIVTFRPASKSFEAESSASAPPSGVTPTQAAAAAGGIVFENADDEQDYYRFNMDPNLWEHMKRIEAVRVHIRKARAKERGETYVQASREQILRDRIMWQKVVNVNRLQSQEILQDIIHSSDFIMPDTSSAKEQASVTSDDETEAASSATPTTAQTQPNEPLVSTEQELDSIKQVETLLIKDFLSITATDDPEVARLFLERCAMNLDQAITLYFEDQS